MKKQEPEFLFAFDENQNLVDVNDLEREQRRKTIYTCIGCNTELIPALGKIKKKHFRHKHIACSGETYLHKLAKEIFYQTYKSCLENNVPFEIEIEQVYRCTKRSCKITDYIAYNLTEYYDGIKVEHKDGNFIPDLLLIHKDKNKSNEKIYIEIKVTHGVSQEKLNSKNKIIEIPISSEDDIQKMKVTKLSELNNNLNIKFFNFKREIKGIEKFRCFCS